MIWVTAEDVVAIHSRIIQVSGGIDGLRDRAGLEAAIAAPLQSFGGEDLFPTDIEKIARIGFGLASNHAGFHHFFILLFYDHPANDVTIMKEGHPEAGTPLFWWVRLELNQRCFRCHGFTDRCNRQLCVLTRMAEPVGIGPTIPWASTRCSTSRATVPYGGERRTRI